MEAVRARPVSVLARPPPANIGQPAIPTNFQSNFAVPNFVTYGTKFGTSGSGDGAWSDLSGEDWRLPPAPLGRAAVVAAAQAHPAGGSYGRR
jgi:hypothetical protein